jgi:choline kinase
MDDQGTKEAVILAAGCGRRLRAAIGGMPKCLAEVGGQTLLERQLRIIHGLGIERVCVVVGDQREMMVSTIGTGCSSCHFMVNGQDAKTNSLRSFWLARTWVSGSFLLMNGDVLADPEIYRRVLAADGNARAYDSSSGDDEEHKKIALEGRQIRSISKGLPAEAVNGENVGILKLDEDVVGPLLAEAQRLILARDDNNWACAAIDNLARTRRIQAVDVSGLPWIEIDSPKDLERARNVVSPVIDGYRQRTAPSLQPLQPVTWVRPAPRAGRAELVRPA